MAIKNSLFNRDVVSKASEFPLKTDSRVIIRARVDGIEGATTLRVGIVVIVLVIISGIPF